MDICFQREVLREATMYTTIAMGLHFLSQSEKKLILHSLQSLGRKPGTASYTTTLHPPLFRSVCSTGQIHTAIVNRTSLCEILGLQRIPGQGSGVRDPT